MIELMKPKLSFAQSEIQDGDVICFQVDLPDKECVPFFLLVAVLNSLVGSMISKAKGYTRIRFSTMTSCRIES